MMVRTLGSVLVAVLLLVGMPGVAAAGTAEAPELVDACGPQAEVGEDTLPEFAPAWTDVCSAWFTTLTTEGGPPVLRVSLALAGDITDRPVASDYYLSWRVGDCLYSVTTVDEHSAPAGEAPGQRFGFRCGESTRTVPCNPPVPGVGCTEVIPQTFVDLPAGTISEAGNVLSATITFDGALAQHAAAHEEGATLTRLHALGGLVNTPNWCYGTDCGSFGTDTAGPGSDYVVEAPATQ